MAVTLLGCWALLCAYVGVWRGDRTSLKLAVAGAIGFGIGFPLAAWLQGMGNRLGGPVDWWKMAEHLIGFCGGAGLGITVLRLEPTWTLPLAVRPVERWLAVVWLLWVLPTWLIANNLDFWIIERAVVPVWVGKAVGRILLMILLGLMVWGWLEIRRGRLFVTSWLPHQLRTLFLLFVWGTVLISATKNLVYGAWTFTPLGFIFLAGLITWLLRFSQLRN